MGEVAGLNELFGRTNEKTVICYEEIEKKTQKKMYKYICTRRFYNKRLTCGTPGGYFWASRARVELVGGYLGAQPSSPFVGRPAGVALGSGGVRPTSPSLSRGSPSPLPPSAACPTPPDTETIHLGSLPMGNQPKTRISNARYIDTFGIT